MNRTILALSCVMGALIVPLHGQEGKTVSLRVTSPAFAEGQPIPPKYTCDGRDVSPPLHWENAPSNTISFAVIGEDPDAPGGTWTHWVIYNLPAAAASLPEGVKKSRALINNWRQGLNDFGKIGYNGPCPPAGGAHRYFFKVYALDTNVSLPAAAKKPDLAKAIEGHIVAQGSLMGMYQRQ